MGEPKRVLRDVKQAEKKNRDANRTETRLSDFGVSGEVHICEKCSKDIPVNTTHLKIFESEFSRKVVRRRCMMCCATWRKDKSKQPEKAPEAPAPVKMEAPAKEKAPVKTSPEKKTPVVEPAKEVVAEVTEDKKVIGDLLNKFKNKK